MSVSLKGYVWPPGMHVCDVDLLARLKGHWQSWSVSFFSRPQCLAMADLRIQELFHLFQVYWSFIESQS